jgi:hypothetical protein
VPWWADFSVCAPTGETPPRGHPLGQQRLRYCSSSRLRRSSSSPAADSARLARPCQALWPSRAGPRLVPQPRRTVAAARFAAFGYAPEPQNWPL